MKLTSAFWLVLAGVFVTANVYLFSTAPEPLIKKNEAKVTFSIEEALTALSFENDITRTVYTREIVGGGKKNGLKFSEKWADEDVHAGPLPALFLRGIAGSLSRSSVPLDLYLGSDYPIESSNLFEGIQAEKFAEIRADGEPKFFYDDRTSAYTAMFPDIATAMPCVSCHNTHEQSAKKDWVLNDIMGATTWSFPSDSITTDEWVEMLSAYRAGVAETYGVYLAKAGAFPEELRPVIGGGWPKSQAQLPSPEMLRDTIDQLTSQKLMEFLVAHAVES
tara:strand:- start:482 stop:1312 length:831 start_codon:yes stop_codon:yes gene_type:complete